ncbi:unnamed protein product [Caretta caretta]
MSGPAEEEGLTAPCSHVGGGHSVRCRKREAAPPKQTHPRKGFRSEAAGFGPSLTRAGPRPSGGRGGTWLHGYFAKLLEPTCDYNFLETRIVFSSSPVTQIKVNTEVSLLIYLIWSWFEAEEMLPMGKGDAAQWKNSKWIGSPQTLGVGGGKDFNWN